MRDIRKPYIKLTDLLSREDYALIQKLQEDCVKKDPVALKLELDYKLGVTYGENTQGMKTINEFMYFDDTRLIGYMGICSFGGEATLEVNGIVHPEYRNQGVFKLLYTLLMDEWRRRPSDCLLLLCDRKSASGQSFIKRTGARYKHSEYEMFLKEERKTSPNREDGIILRKATNSDWREIARQNAIYFGDEEPAESSEKAAILPEEEELRGVAIYLAEKNGEIIGKIHLQLISGVGGIYGLGILPEYRGKGYGRALLLMGVEKLKQGGAKEIMLQVAAENANAISLYSSSGFVETSVMDYFEMRKQA